MTSPGLICPDRIVPVKTHPLPLSLKKWSTAQRNGILFNLTLLIVFFTLLGILKFLRIYKIKGSIPLGASIVVPSWSLGAAETGTIGISFPNLVWAKTFSLNNAVFLSNYFVSWLNKSILLRATIKESAQNSNYPTTMHSAVWTCIPLLISITRIIWSIIEAPLRTVLIREAWPGQSTIVNRIWS